MRESVGWLKRIFSRGRSDVLALLTPEVVRERSALTRFVVAGGTIAAMFGAAVIGLAGLAALLFAVAAVYFLATQVLGLKVNVDPQAFYQQFYRPPQPNYGAN